MRRRLAAFALLVGGWLAILAADQFVGRADAVVSTAPAPNAIQAKLTAIPTLRITHDPFVPLARLTAPRQGAMVGVTVNGSSGMMVPNPGQGPEVIVLCATLVSTNSQAVFLDGNRVVYAHVGSQVGGNVVNAIDVDRVQFADGQRIEVTDCGAPNGGSGSSAATQSAANAGPAASGTTTFSTAPNGSTVPSIPAPRIVTPPTTSANPFTSSNRFTNNDTTAPLSGFYGSNSASGSQQMQPRPGGN